MSDPGALIELPATDVDDARTIVAMRVVEFSVTTTANGVHGLTYMVDTGDVETYTCASLEHASEIEAYVGACVRLAVDSVALLREIERLTRLADHMKAGRHRPSNAGDGCDECDEMFAIGGMPTAGPSSGES